MPTYEYACTACAERLEVVQSFTDASLTECPSCAGKLRKVFSPVGVVFKGSGFYKTDSRQRTGSAGSKGDSSAASDGGSDAGSAAAGKSDSGKSDPGKSDPGKSEPGQSSSGKSDSAKTGGSGAGATPAVSASSSSGSGAKTG